MAENNEIKLKNSVDGIEFTVENRHENEELYKLFREFITSKKELFEGVKFAKAKVYGESFTDEQKTELSKIILNSIECDAVEYVTMGEDFKNADMVRKEEKKIKRRFIKVVEEERICHKEFTAPTKYVEGTVRSGDTVEYSGNVIVFGDVNAGAMVKAKGSVCVLGTLKGTVHAGCEGDENAYVYALCMVPLQIRIGNIMAAKAPDNRQRLTIHPETAKLVGDNIVIESAINTL